MQHFNVAKKTILFHNLCIIFILFIKFVFCISIPFQNFRAMKIEDFKKKTRKIKNTQYLSKPLETLIESFDKDMGKVFKVVVQ